jgi:7-carboxy-7-deazaguanine synthase
MTPAAIMARVNELAGGKPVLVSLSGGNPALQPLAPLIALGRESGTVLPQLHVLAWGNKRGV